MVEGEIDCMSVFECGANCIGLGSTSNIKKIFNYDTSQTTLIIALDNDLDRYSRKSSKIVLRAII